ncbi:MAG: DUF4160 domain-containing protein [Candidatus Hydrogenedentota bacterium]
MIWCVGVKKLDKLGVNGIYKTSLRMFISRKVINIIMSPTVFRYKGYRFFFFSREEKRIHIHVSSGKGEAKFWLEPSVSLVQNYKLSPKDLRYIQKIIKERKDEIKDSWKKHFHG